MKILGSYDRKYLLGGVVYAILVTASHFLAPTLYNFLVSAGGFIFLASIVLLFFPKYRLRAWSFLFGLFGSLAAFAVAGLVAAIILVSLGGR